MVSKYDPRLGFDVEKHNPMCNFGGHVCPCGQIPIGGTWEKGPGKPTPPVLQPWTPECDILDPDDTFDYAKSRAPPSSPPARRAIVIPNRALTHDPETQSHNCGRAGHRCTCGDRITGKSHSVHHCPCGENQLERTQSDNTKHEESGSGSFDSGSDSSFDSSSDDSSDDDESKTGHSTSKIAKSKWNMEDDAQNFNPFCGGRCAKAPPKSKPEIGDGRNTSTSDDDNKEAARRAIKFAALNGNFKRTVPVETSGPPKARSDQSDWNIYEEQTELPDGVTHRMVRVAYRFEGNRMISKVFIKTVNDKGSSSSENDYQFLCETERGHTTCKNLPKLADTHKSASPVGDSIAHRKNGTHIQSSTPTPLSTSISLARGKRATSFETSTTLEPSSFPHFHTNPLRIGGLSPGNHGGFAAGYRPPRFSADATSRTASKVVRQLGVLNLDPAIQRNLQNMRTEPVVISGLEGKDRDFGPYGPLIPFIDLHGEIIPDRPHRKGPSFASDATKSPRTSSAAAASPIQGVRRSSAERNGETMGRNHRIITAPVIHGDGGPATGDSSLAKRSVSNQDRKVVIVEIHQIVGTLDDEPSKNDTEKDPKRSSRIYLTDPDCDKSVPFEELINSRPVNRPKHCLVGLQDAAEELPNAQPLSEVKLHGEHRESVGEAGILSTSIGDKATATTTPESTYLLTSELPQERFEFQYTSDVGEDIPFTMPTLTNTKPGDTALHTWLGQSNGDQSAYPTLPTSAYIDRKPTQPMNRPMAADFGYIPRGQEGIDWVFDNFRPPPYFGNAGMKNDRLAIHWVILFVIIIASLLCYGI